MGRTAGSTANQREVSMSVPKTHRLQSTLSMLAALLACSPAFAQAPAADAKPFKLGVVTFLSGAAAGPFGVPARNGAEILVEALNAGKAPAPYAKKGLGGRPIELVFLDEAGGTTKQVSEYRDLVQRQNVDAVIGYISSGDCLAVAPVAEELKKLTVFFDCGTPRIFEDASYKYVFRSSSHATMDNVAAALYVTEMLPAVKKVAGINQNYAWGQDSWTDFEAAIKVLKPDVQITTSQMPKLLAGQYGAEISALMTSSPDVIHSSFWGGDLDAFVLQAVPRGALKKSTAVLTCGETATHKLAGQIPDGTIIGARGPHGAYAPDNELNRFYRAAYQDRFVLYPNYPAYHMSQAILGLKAAYEKAQGAGSAAPTQDQVIAAFEGLTFETPSGTIKMALGKGHQAVEGTVYGMAKTVDGKLTFVNVKQYPAERVNPPEGAKSADWIKTSFKAGK
jgi:branched-chain amino acid transport system substrate-binding protein